MSTVLLNHAVTQK